MIIYKVTNLINNKVYIGQTVNSLKERRTLHFIKAKNGSKCHFHNALCKYGIDNFKWQVICICPSIDSLNKQEQYYIIFYNSMDEGYNITNGGLNYIMSDEHKEKIRISNLGKKVSEETKEKMRGKNNHFYGKKHTKETLKIISDKLSGENNPFYGKKHSEETRKKIRNNHPDFSGKNNPNYKHGKCCK